MRTSLSYHKTELPQYVEALLQTPERKVCTNLSKIMNTSHDMIYRELKSSIGSIRESQRSLETIAHNMFGEKHAFLILDDTHLAKRYASKIEGVEWSFDGSTGMTSPGIKMLTAMLTSEQFNLPIDCVPYISKELMQGYYKTKSALAASVIKHTVNAFVVERVLADAHFSTIEMLNFLIPRSINFLMKISRSRVVTINGMKGQLKNILRLNKNEHVKIKKAEINGNICYISVVKIAKDNSVYLISNDEVDVKDVINLYRKRWKIETFHRTAKQHLGMGECQMRSIEKQRQHVLYVMQAYAHASIHAALNCFNCVEHYLNYYRHAKALERYGSITPSAQLSHVIA